MASRRLPPKWVSKAAPDDPQVMEGVDPLPNAMGVNRKALRQSEVDSEATKGAQGVDASTKDPMHNGSNPSIADSIAFASGKDTRMYDGAGSSKGSNPTPAKPGA